MSQTWLFASGKGGVGKSMLVANLGLILARAGKTVTVVDTDIGLRAQDALLGLENQVVYDLLDVAKKGCLLEQALLSSLDLPQLRLLPAAQFARVRDLEPKRFEKILSALKETSDFVLVDCPAGIERGLRNALNAGADETVIVVTPDDLCIRDAERTCGLIDRKKLPRPRLIVNRLNQDLIREGTMYSAQVVSDVLDLPLLGEVPEDSAVYQALLRHAFVTDFRCEAREALLRIAARMTGDTPPLPGYGKKKTGFFKKHFPGKLKEVSTPNDR